MIRKPPSNARAARRPNREPVSRTTARPREIAATKPRARRFGTFAPAALVRDRRALRELVDCFVRDRRALRELVDCFVRDRRALRELVDR
jgi:hypothetical protein